MVKVLITGIGGFIGSFLAEYLLQKEVEVYGIIHSKDKIERLEHIEEDLLLYECDVNKASCVKDVVQKVKPEIIFHLAAQAYVIPSWKDPVTTIRTNVLGTLHLLESVRNSHIDPVIIVACSSAAYGDAASRFIPLKETAPLLPLSPYGVSKAAQEMLCYQYFRNFGLKVIRARIFGTIGPRKTGDVCADFAGQIAKIERGLQEPVIFVGNLGTKRDLTDVRDVVKALWLLKEKGKYGDVYNVCSGRAYEIKQILNQLLLMGKADIKIKQDQTRMRFSDEPIILGDNTKISETCGWKPERKINESLAAILDYWRNKVNFDST
jgi:GDP-4-dehydro-6-deoxy-D-mannose reductase